MLLKAKTSRLRLSALAMFCQVWMALTWTAALIALLAIVLLAVYLFCQGCFLLAECIVHLGHALP